MNIKHIRTKLAITCLVLSAIACAGTSMQITDERAEEHALKLIAAYQKKQMTSTPGTVITDTATDTSVPATIPSSNESVTWINLPSDIAFVSNHDTYWTFNVRSARDHKVRQLTNDTNETSPEAWFDYGIAWSPIDEKIAFVSNRDGDDDIYVMNSDGSGVIKLTQNTANDTEPAWSPDGKQLVFVSMEGGTMGIFRVNVDGSEQMRLSSETQNDFSPVWSPDGKTIAFVSNRDGSSEIYSMSTDGSSQTRLTYGAGFSNSLAWSPTGNKIMFTSAVSQSQQIYVMNADGTDLARLTERTSSWNNQEDRAAWSPDGEKIAFISTLSVCMVNADGSGKVFNFNTPDVLGSLSWSPDSKYIVFSSWNGIYVVNADDGQMTRVVESPNTASPVWSHVCANCP